jgi:hypothetical protein
MFCVHGLALSFMIVYGMYTEPNIPRLGGLLLITPFSQLMVHTALPPG